MSVNWTRPDHAKIPYSPWKDFKLSRFAAKLRKALGMRSDEDGNNTTHREDFKRPDGTAYPDKSNLCHHFEQDGENADAVKISVRSGSTLVLHVKNGYTGNVIEIYEQNANGTFPSTPTKKMDKDGAWT